MTKKNVNQNEPINSGDNSTRITTATCWVGARDGVFYVPVLLAGGSEYLILTKEILKEGLIDIPVPGGMFSLIENTPSQVKIQVISNDYHNLPLGAASFRISLSNETFLGLRSQKEVKMWLMEQYRHISMPINAMTPLSLEKLMSDLAEDEWSKIQSEEVKVVGFGAFDSLNVRKSIEQEKRELLQQQEKNRKEWEQKHKNNKNK